MPDKIWERVPDQQLGTPDTGVEGKLYIGFSCHLMTDAKILALTCVIDIGLAGVELMTITVVHRK